ncbi:Cell division protein FtsI/penicillin-binding protein 2 [Micromonospora phaseoli]|uniref:Cell division protein FtsI/penicillin-binding protein 2 n=1 Tax=Micromonospora phaseoli TaxID=1144548 RepID=A0A1H6WNN6_9ACTN|nr:penicillin-binding transpeptidase domain-containing protein [Micromonospora phaseoli]PZW01728.1 cell division protein FtsI/penicillin-binding protein 2 [Micromonospora phaseoli]GIJ80896.1 cell division protein FtsI [Micromonospora phaseoli]SEJ14092.1 Cell division protein FtsI/penicillin-binding protein 2 [Micromonospora phaseoli]
MHRPQRPHRSKSRFGVFAACLVAATGLVACSGEDGPQRSVDAFLAGWRSGDLQAVGFVDPTGAKIAAADVAREIKDLSGELAGTPPTLSRQGDPEVVQNTATATIRVEWALPGETNWTYDRPVRLTQGRDDQWQVIWEPQIVQEQLTRGDRLGLSRDAAERAAVLDGAGEPIVTPRAVVRVRLHPRAVTDVEAVTRELDQAFRAIRPAITPPVDLSNLAKRLDEADPDGLVEVVTLRDEAYRQIKPRIYDLPGTQFRAEKPNLAPTREFARAVLGSVDPAQADDLAEFPDRYSPGDLVGHGGLQERWDERLRGVPGLNVIIKRPGSDGTLEPTGTEVFRREPQPGQPLRTTLDVAAQNAADQALRAERKRSALVAVRVSDGAVLAAANGPGAAGENLAFTAQVPPGSTFKMVSALGLVERGAVTPDTTVDCPRTRTVDGRSFKNSNDFELGEVPFRTVFAKSCNTAFAALAPQLGADGLAVTGRTLGLEGQWNVGLDAFTGKISAGGGATEQAAAAIGQGTTLVSPLAMAAATAAVAKGSFIGPRLLLDPAPEPAAEPGPELKPEAVAAVREMMREVIVSGTGSALKDVPGEPVHGKTGTAEYDNNPKNTHAWFVGWQGDVAFAVFVEKGGSGSGTAAPIAERFLRALSR